MKKKYAKLPRVLHKEYASFRTDVIDYFVNDVLPKAEDLLDPMAGTASLLPYADRLGISAYFNDLIPVHSYINAAKQSRVYFALIRKFGKQPEKVSKELQNILKGLRGDTLVISDSWIDEAVLDRLEEAWNKIKKRRGSLRVFFLATVLLSVRYFASVTNSMKNKTWYRAGGMSSEKSLAEISDMVVKRFFNYYNMFYSDEKEVKGGAMSFSTGDCYRTFGENKFNLIVTSPSFPNRYDYVVMYAPEIYFLSRVEGCDTVEEFRGRALGTNRVVDYELNERDDDFLRSHAPSTFSFICDVRAKQRHGENNYYPRYFQKYYINLFQCIDAWINKLRSDGSMYLVLQNNIHRGELNELDRFTQEFCANWGCKVEVVFRELRTHQGRRNISGEHPLVVKKHNETILKIQK